MRKHLEQRRSPRQVSNRRRAEFQGRPDMQVVPEAVHRALHGRGSRNLANRSGIIAADRAYWTPATSTEGAPVQAIPGHGCDP